MQPIRTGRQIQKCENKKEAKQQQMKTISHYQNKTKTDYKETNTYANRRRDKELKGWKSYQMFIRLQKTGTKIQRTRKKPNTRYVL